jgi:hypothetical protein
MCSYPMLGSQVTSAGTNIFCKIELRPFLGSAKAPVSWQCQFSDTIDLLAYLAVS